MRNYISRLHIKSFRGIKDLELDDLQPEHLRNSLLKGKIFL